MSLKRKMAKYEILVVNGVRIRFLERAEILVQDFAELEVWRTHPQNEHQVLSRKTLGNHKKPS